MFNIIKEIKIFFEDTEKKEDSIVSFEIKANEKEYKCISFLFSFFRVVVGLEDPKDSGAFIVVFDKEMSPVSDIDVSISTEHFCNYDAIEGVVYKKILNSFMYFMTKKETTFLLAVCERFYNNFTMMPDEFKRVMFCQLSVFMSITLIERGIEVLEKKKVYFKNGTDVHEYKIESASEVTGQSRVKMADADSGEVFRLNFNRKTCEKYFTFL